jgi:hypothetical protein
VSARVLDVKLDKQQIALSLRSGSASDVARGPRPANKTVAAADPIAARAIRRRGSGKTPPPQPKSRAGSVQQPVRGMLGKLRGVE